MVGADMPAPGRVFSYSNPGYTLAGLVIEKAGGKPFADQMRERIFVPMGMGRTTFRPTDAMTYPLAAAHGGDSGDSAHVLRPLADDARKWPAGYMTEVPNIFGDAHYGWGVRYGAG